MVRKATSSNRQKILEAREPFIFNLKTCIQRQQDNQPCSPYKSGSIQTFNPSFRLEQKLSNSVSASFSGEYLDTDGIYKFRYYRKYPNGQIAYDTIAKRHDADVKAKRFETSINGDLKNGKWDLRAYAYLSNRGLPGAIVNGRFGDEGQRLKDANYFVQGAGCKNLPESTNTTES